MRLPVIPFVIAATLLAAVYYLFNATHSDRRSLDVPRLNRITDIEGIETEVAVSPDGSRIAVIATGDLWVLTMADGQRKQITRTAETEWFPAWTPDGKRIGFSRGTSTFTIDPESGAEELFL